MEQINVVLLRKKNFSETLEIKRYMKRQLENLLVVKYRVNGKYHRMKNE